jgi:hypothetical protein
MGVQLRPFASEMPSTRCRMVIADDDYANNTDYDNV